MITITNFDEAKRSITFTANGQSFTKTGLGTFASKKELLEWCESIARTESAPAPSLGVDIADMLGKPLASKDLPEVRPTLDHEA
jgi:hypothetical protein